MYRSVLALLPAFILTAAVIAQQAEPAKPAAPLNTLTDAEKADGWILLFDGKSTAGWRLLGGDKIPEESWTVKDGVLVHLPKGGGKDIIYNKPFENFELSWEWNVPKPNGNSGI